MRVEASTLIPPLVYTPVGHLAFFIVVSGWCFIIWKFSVIGGSPLTGFITHIWGRKSSDLRCPKAVGSNKLTSLLLWLSFLSVWDLFRLHPLWWESLSISLLQSCVHWARLQLGCPYPTLKTASVIKTLKHLFLPWAKFVAGTLNSPAPLSTNCSALAIRYKG